MNFQKYKFLIIGGGICALLLAGGLFLLIKYRAGYVTVNSELKTSSQTLSSLRSNHPFPSEANIEVVNTNLKQVRSSLADLKERMGEGQVKPLAIERAEFPQELEKTLRGLRLSATNQNVNLPDDGFDFGFERYAKGDLPDKDKVSRLTTQLQIVAHLSELLFQSGIRELLEVERDVFEATTGGATGMINPAMMGRGMMPGAMPGMNLEEPESELYTKERLTLTFEATDSALWRVLNILGADPMFVTVVSVNLRNESRPDGSGPTKIGERPGGGARLSSRGGGLRRSVTVPVAMDYNERMMRRETGTASAAPGETEPKEPEVSDLSHDERVVAGRESVLASIQVDVLMLQTDDKPEEDIETTEEATP